MPTNSKNLKNKALKVLSEEGLVSLARRTKNYLKKKHESAPSDSRALKDILFINGCSIPQCERYRVDHQIEQLEAFGLSCDKVDYSLLTLDHLKFYRGFVFYRCPILPVIKDFIKLAKENNKTVFYDIDDLVFDLKNTSKLDVVKAMNEKDRAIYDDGVTRMRETLKLCEYGITTTSRLQNEMEKLLGEGKVYINRNVASEAMLKHSLAAIDSVTRRDKRIILGYFSGSMTHNADFDLITPALKVLFEKYDHLYLKVAGELHLPDALQPFEQRILSTPFVDWTELPKVIRSVDINLAPLEPSTHNESKSENKWTEAALVKVPTVASRVGAFVEAVEDGKTGLLCDNTPDAWVEALSRLIEDADLRATIASNAFAAVEKSLTTSSGRGVADFIRSRLHPSLAFVLPSTNVSGGIMVAEKHAAILKQHGYDVTLLNAEPNETNVNSEGCELNVVSALRPVFAHFDTLVATMWLTLEFVQKYPFATSRKYLVQNYEPGFYSLTAPERCPASATYARVAGVDYLTVSQWCKSWLEEKYGIEDVKLAPNGINADLFRPRPRNFSKRKIRILVEGNSASDYKNTDESFRVIDKLDLSKFEVHYLSQGEGPKKFYHVDHSHIKVPFAEVHKIYESCDILLKSSRLESFSYPPLEMMATGGYCVVAPNDGKIEYLKDGDNCLLYEPGNLDDAVAKIMKIVKDKDLRARLDIGADITVHNRNWRRLEDEILKAYR